MVPKIPPNPYKTETDAEQVMQLKQIPTVSGCTSLADPWGI